MGSFSLLAGLSNIFVIKSQHKVFFGFEEAK